MKSQFVSWLRRFAIGAAVAFAGAVALGEFAVAQPYELTEGSDLFGELGAYTTTPDDTLLKVAEVNKLGFIELTAANPGIDPWLPGPDVTLVLPTLYLLPRVKRAGIVLNLPEQRLYQFLPEGRVQSFPVVAGNLVCEPEPGQTVIEQRRREPSWRPTAAVRAKRPDLPVVVPPGPRNPLGKYALDLALPGKIIHGARRPFSDRAGKGHGCIQLYTDDMAVLYDASRKGMEVAVIDQPIKLGWSNGELYLEVHPTREQGVDLSGLRRMRYVQVPGFDTLLAEAAGSDLDRVDLVLARKLLRERKGIPVKISHPRPPPKAKKVRGLFGP